MDGKLKAGKLPIIPLRRKFQRSPPHTYRSNFEDLRLNPSLEKTIETRKLNLRNMELEKMREKREQVGHGLQAQWRHLELNEKKFKDLVIRHNQFLKNNFNKRARAEAKLEQSQILTKNRQNDIDKIKEWLKEMRSIAETLFDELSKYKIYADFLNRTIDFVGSPFRSITELLNSYENLETIRESRLKKNFQETEMILQYHMEFLDTIHDENFEYVGIINEITYLSAKYEELTRKNIIMDITITEIVKKINKFQGELWCCLHMIDSMYSCICLRRKIIPKSRYNLNDIEPKLSLIKRTLEIWSKRMKMYSRSSFTSEI